MNCDFMTAGQLTSCQHVLKASQNTTAFNVFKLFLSAGVCVGFKTHCGMYSTVNPIIHSIDLQLTAQVAIS